MWHLSAGESVARVALRAHVHNGHKAVSYTADPVELLPSACGDVEEQMWQARDPILLPEYVPHPLSAILISVLICGRDALGVPWEYCIGWVPVVPSASNLAACGNADKADMCAPRTQPHRSQSSSVITRVMMSERDRKTDGHDCRVRLGTWRLPVRYDTPQSLPFYIAPEVCAALKGKTDGVTGGLAPKAFRVGLLLVAGEGGRMGSCLAEQAQRTHGGEALASFPAASQELLTLEDEDGRREKEAAAAGIAAVTMTKTSSVGLSQSSFGPDSELSGPLLASLERGTHSRIASAIQQETLASECPVRSDSNAFNSSLVAEGETKEERGACHTAYTSGDMGSVLSSVSMEQASLTYHDVAISNSDMQGVYTLCSQCAHSDADDSMEPRASVREHRIYFDPKNVCLCSGCARFQTQVSSRPCRLLKRISCRWKGRTERRSLATRTRRWVKTRRDCWVHTSSQTRQRLLWRKMRRVRSSSVMTGSVSRLCIRLNFSAGERYIALPVHVSAIPSLFAFLLLCTSAADWHQQMTSSSRSSSLCTRQ
jgi:hypothetical protein